MPAPPPDPRYTEPSGPTAPGEGFGQPTLMTPEAQRRQLEIQMSTLFRAGLSPSDPLFISLVPSQQDALVERLDAWAYHAPALFNEVAGILRGEFGYDPANPESAPSGFNIDAGIAAAFNDIITTAETRQSEEDRQTTTRTDRESQTTVDTEGSTVRERETERTTTRFVDLPTPEEFMNEFRTGFASYTQGLRQQGLITQQAADWMIDHPDVFYDRYLADLSDRIARGEDVFKVVGTSGDTTFIGERPGGKEILETTGIDRERVYREVVSNEREQTVEEVIRDLTETGTITTTVEGTSPGQRVQNLTAEEQQQVNSEVDRRLNERANTLINEAIEYFGTESEITTEQIFSRPNLTARDRTGQPIFKISPKAFLSSTFTPTTLENLAVGRRGRERAQAETSGGIAPSAPRRVG